MDFARSFLLLIFVVNCLTAIEGPKIINLSSAHSEMVMSDDGSTIVITYSTVKDAEVFSKTGDGFAFNHSLPGSTGS